MIDVFEVLFGCQLGWYLDLADQVLEVLNCCKTDVQRFKGIVGALEAETDAEVVRDVFIKMDVLF